MKTYEVTWIELHKATVNAPNEKEAKLKAISIPDDETVQNLNITETKEV